MNGKAGVLPGQQQFDPFGRDLVAGQKHAQDLMPKERLQFVGIHPRQRVKRTLWVETAIAAQYMEMRVVVGSAVVSLSRD